MTNGNSATQLDVLREQAKALMTEVAHFLNENGQTLGEEIVRGLQHRVGALDFILVSTPNDLAQITQSTNHLRESLAKACDILTPGSSAKKEQVFVNQGPARTPSKETAVSGWKKMTTAIGNGAQMSGRAAKNAFWASAAAGMASWRFMQFLWRSVSILGTILLTLHTVLFFSHIPLPFPLSILGSAGIAPLVWIVYVLTKVPHLVTQKSGDESALVKNVMLSLVPSHILCGIGFVAVFGRVALPSWGWPILLCGLGVVFSVLLMQLYFSMRLAERTGEFGIGTPGGT